MEQKRCIFCMSQVNEETGTCPVCGKNARQYQEKSHCLPPFTRLQNRYLTGRVLGEGGFGITYLAWDETLKQKTAVKEYYPLALVRGRWESEEKGPLHVEEKWKTEYEEGKESFLREARLLFAAFDESGLVRVQDYFEENGTAYLVMEYLSGGSLSEELKKRPGHRIEEKESKNMLLPILDALMYLHGEGIIHGDISPDNLVFDSEGNLKLIDFGAAAQKGKERKKPQIKHSYAPPEFYRGKGVGPWSDIYSLCALWYQMLSGKKPLSAPERMNGKMLPAILAAGPSGEMLIRSIQRGLELDVQKRYFCVVNLMESIGIPVTKKKDFMDRVREHWGDSWLVLTTDTGSDLLAQKAGRKRWKKKRIRKICAAAFALFLCLYAVLRVTYQLRPEKYYAAYADYLRKKQKSPVKRRKLYVGEEDYGRTLRYLESAAKETTKQGETYSRSFDLTKKVAKEGRLEDTSELRLYMSLDMAKRAMESCMKRTWYIYYKSYSGYATVQMTRANKAIDIVSQETLDLQNEQGEALSIRYDIVSEKCFEVNFTGKKKRAEEFLYKMVPVFCPETWLTKKECGQIIEKMEKENGYYGYIYPMYEIAACIYNEDQWYISLSTIKGW